MKLPSIPLVVLDTETTGFVPRVHRVIEFASVEVRDGKMVKEYEQLFACDEIPPHVEVITRIKTPDLQGKPTFSEKLAEVTAHIPEDCVIVGQNIGFDIGMLKGEGIDLSDRPWIDTSMLASMVFPELRSYSLGYMSTILQLNHNPPHRALGDVRATLELLGKCWERFLEMPEEMMETTRKIMAKSTPGYAALFSALPASSTTKKPLWLIKRPVDDIPASTGTVPIPVPEIGKVELRDEPIDHTHLHGIIRSAITDTKTTHWIAVKNLRSTLRRLPPDLQPDATSSDVRVLYPAYSLLDETSRERFLQQDSYTADEATLAVKLAWYLPTVAPAGAKAGLPKMRDDLPIHGGEDSVWTGKLIATSQSQAYVDQFRDAPGVLLLDHRELLRFLEVPDHLAHQCVRENTHMIIDDASMLEDTATKAYGWHCGIDSLRAAAKGQPLLEKFVDLLQLWIEKTRQSQDLRYIADSDVRSPEARGLREQLTELLRQEWPDRTREELQSIDRILDPKNLGGRITWIELRQNGSQNLESVPEHVSSTLNQTLYAKFPTTLLTPAHCHDRLPEIIPPTLTPQHTSTQARDAHLPQNTLPVLLAAEPTLDAVLTNPPSGKTIILLPGRSTIEDLYVKYTEKLESQKVTLICQGMSGGQGRMQAEFLAAPAPALWLLTPWMFEGIELPLGSVDHLLLKSLPFDHPHHPVLSRRAARYRNAFSEYSVPRLLHRLFRILRTFSRIKTPDADVRVLDERLWTKGYGKDICAFLEHFNGAHNAALPNAKTKSATKTDDKQMRLF